MLDLIGYTAGFFLMWSFLPQVIKTATTRTTEGLSVPMLVITLISGILYEIYANKVSTFRIADAAREVFCLMQFAIWHRLFIEDGGRTKPSVDEDPRDWV